MGFFGSKVLGQAVAGGLAGGMWGSLSDPSLKGFGTGAAIGAGVGVFGPTIGRRMMAGRKSFAGHVATGLGGLGGLASRIPKIGGTIDRGLTRAAGFVGTNQNRINRIGAGTLLALGTASSAYIGSSILSSNRGY